ncbi:hypothetical protein N7447_011013 [Penicillium robsamsonii]|uniref:uncharacterized protein n=1 Tax=Penicillium robsamsonii TaxID=1792511 RepID=UPI00254730CB|nr:uncharacterized protein N7447_011013 [Penicillium robsamsonii]KAJ5807557.1 hypothetical protein N7447_011013 [Penicillium robsamsonii]
MAVSVSSRQETQSQPSPMTWHLSHHPHLDTTAYSQNTEPTSSDEPLRILGKMSKDTPSQTKNSFRSRPVCGSCMLHGWMNRAITGGSNVMIPQYYYAPWVSNAMTHWSWSRCRKC